MSMYAYMSTAYPPPPVYTPPPLRKQVDPVRQTRPPRPDKNRPRANISMDMIVGNMRSFLDELDRVYKNIENPVRFFLLGEGSKRVCYVAARLFVIFVGILCARGRVWWGRFLPARLYLTK